jgi:hypothetical protein
MLLRRRTLGFLVAYAALARGASAAAGALLDPSMVDGCIRTFSDHSLITIEGRVIRPPEEFPGRERFLRPR